MLDTVTTKKQLDLESSNHHQAWKDYVLFRGATMIRLIAKVVGIAVLTPSEQWGAAYAK